jgi:hypothetical protein
MAGLKQAIFGAAATAVIACVPVVPAAAAGHGYGLIRPWGIGRGLVGAVVGLATLPLAIVSAAVSAGEQGAPASPAYGSGSYGYAPPASYPVPPVYYAPRAAYYPPVSAYYSAPRAYYGSRAYYGPRAYYAAGPGYHQRGYAYPRR